MTDLSTLREIKNWKLEANEEESNRYFFRFEDVNSVLSGERCFVIGRKGTGKTAVAEYVRNRTKKDTFVSALNFQHFPFNELYRLDDDSYKGASRYITLWKYLIYSTICSMMANNPNVTENVRHDLRETFDLDFEHALSHTITKITARKSGLAILGTGANHEKGMLSVQNDVPWKERVAALEKIIINYASGSTYYILFDSLDEDFGGILDKSVDPQYTDLIVSLFKAIHSIRPIFKNCHLNIHPIAFLRTDIFDLLRDNDKNKWRDLTVLLDWNETSLQELVAFRISRAISTDGNTLSFDEAWNQVFKNVNIRSGRRGSTKRTAYRHMIRNSLLRPRDIIANIRECAKLSIIDNNELILPATIKSADAPYSEYLRGEFVDEIPSIIPYFEDILDMFSEIRKHILHPSELEPLYNDLAVDSDVIKLSFTKMCETLFHFGVIGNLPRQTNREVFKYISPRARFNKNEKIILHRGLLKALQIY